MTQFNFDLEDHRPARFAARMPILSGDEKVFGYKLLFRTDFGSVLSPSEGDVASRSVIDMSSLIGFNTLSNNLPAFIVATRATLVGDYLALLPSSNVIAEVPDSVFADPEVMRSCRQLKNAGYKIALNNFRTQDPREELVETADFLKVDIKSTPLTDVSRLIRRYNGLPFIAEKVETREDFEFCKREGFSLFEGYFFRKPETMRARGAQSNRTVYLRLLAAVSKPTINWIELEEIIKSDPMLYFRLLRYLNSAVFGLQGEINNVRHALTYLGENEIRRWCRLSGMLELSKNKPSDLALAALVRARFAELISDNLKCVRSDLFQIGLLSLMDAILEIPMREVLDGLPLDEAARNALIQNKGPLSPIYELIIAVEAGIWPRVTALSAQLGIDQEFTAKSQWDAMAWAQSIVSAA
jgi:c-di-GMP-related signal transduction protein